jgi:structural maintenance of chromosome 4
LDEITEQRVEKVHKLKIAEKDKDNLAGSKNEAEKYLEIEREIRKSSNKVCQIQEYKSTKNMLKMVEQVNEMKEKVSNDRSKLKENEAALSKLHQSHNELNTEYNEICSALEKSTKVSEII